MKSLVPDSKSIPIIVVIILVVAFVLLAWSGVYLSHQFARLGEVEAAAPQLVVTATSEMLPTVSASPTIPVIPTATPLPTATIPANGVVQIIGSSVEGRPLEVYQFGNGEHVLMIVAGIHGGYEYNTVALADGLIENLKSGGTLVPADVTLYILRNLNPDGYAAQLGPDGRANANGVDLNRNWDADWHESWYGTDCWNKRYLTAGTEPMSEPEVQALAGFMLEKHAEALISYHSAGLGIFPGGWWKHQPSLDLAAQLALDSPYLYPPYDADCEYTGQFVDWAASNGIAAVDIELTNHTDTDLGINLYILVDFLDWSSYLRD